MPRLHRHTPTRRALFVAVAAIGVATVATGVGNTDDRVGASGNDPSGQTVPTADLDGWRHIYADDFPTDIATGDFPTEAFDKWRVYPGPWRDTSDKGQYAPKKVLAVQDGVLTKSLRTEDGQPLVAAIVPKVPGTKRWVSSTGATRSGCEPTASTATRSRGCSGPTKAT